MADHQTRILIIDSNTYISGKIAEQISAIDPGCLVSQCHTMPCAQILMADHPFQLVLMDALTTSISEPIFQQIRDCNPQARILLYSSKLTGAEYAAVKTAALECGADFFGDEGELITQVREDCLVQNNRIGIGARKI